MERVRKVIEINEALCNGCGQCVTSCAEGAIQIINGKARLVSDRYCDGLGACLGECPTGALRIVERAAEAFDEVAVKQHLSNLGTDHEFHHRKEPISGQSGSEIRGLSPNSALTHWPVQIRLVPPHAPFLQGADLLIMADCVPVAYADTHRDLIQGRAVLVGCPKFDNAQEYVQRFADILCTAQPRSVTVAVMEVPCCHGLPRILQQAIAIAGVEVPVEIVVISLDGKVLQRTPMA